MEENYSFCKWHFGKLENDECRRVRITEKDIISVLAHRNTTVMFPSGVLRSVQLRKFNLVQFTIQFQALCSLFKEFLPFVSWTRVNSPPELKRHGNKIHPYAFTQKELVFGWTSPTLLLWWFTFINKHDILIPFGGIRKNWKEVNRHIGSEVSQDYFQCLWWSKLNAIFKAKMNTQGMSSFILTGQFGRFDYFWYKYLIHPNYVCNIITFILKDSL